MPNGGLRYFCSMWCVRKKKDLYCAKGEKCYFIEQMMLCS
jgi:hypothetical protein